MPRTKRTTTRNRKQQPVPLLAALNVFGLDHLDVVILAALADARPLLLIGPHGTAKSELLNRLAGALGLEHRHYNASLISFDDLLGYPVPNAARDGLEYLRTPGDLWDAQSVFLDEISRCRPEHQNKLFSLIHERRVQGLPLERLQYRWAAMNPPLSMDGSDLDSDEPVYHGSLPLDPALADRFAWIARVPDVADIDPAARRRLLTCGGVAPKGDAGLPDLVARARQLVERPAPALRAWAVSYVDAVVAPLRDARLAISGRRAVMLVDAIVALEAAACTLGRPLSPAEAAEAALRCCLPHAAAGVTVELKKVLAAHKLALQLAGTAPDGTWRRLREESDPVRRVAIALGDPELSRAEVSELVADAFAAQDPATRYLLARVLAPVLERHDRVTAATLETITEPLRQLLAFSIESAHEKECSRARARELDKVLAAVSRLQKQGHPDAAALGNALCALFAMDLNVRNPNALVARHDEWQALFAPLLVGADA